MAASVAFDVGRIDSGLFSAARAWDLNVVGMVGYISNYRPQS
jgi:hypothetical protein